MKPFLSSAIDKSEMSPTGLWRMFFKPEDGPEYFIVQRGVLRKHMEGYGLSLSQRYAKQGQFLRVEPAVGA